MDPDAPPRLPYSPALDGVRALAVLAVLAFHQPFDWASGGFLGVSLFFTLSGFLITSLLIAEHDATGRVRLGAFWARRARRLLPASLLALVLAMVVSAAVVPDAQRVEVAGDIRAAVLNVANWRYIILDVPYFDLFRVPSPVQHYWSLAIEEQLYLVVPIIAAIALRRRRAGLGIALGALVAFSLWRQLSLEEVDRIYFGTDTRAAELAIGGLLAVGHRGLRSLDGYRRYRVADVAGWVGLAATVVLWWGVDRGTPALYEGGLAALAVVSVLLVVGAVDGASLSSVLGFRPLVALGRMSYGIYLLHFPLFLWLNEDRTGLGGWPLFAVRGAVTLSAAATSYVLLERPIRTGRTLRTRLAPAFALTGIGAITLVSLALAPESTVSTGVAGAEAAAPGTATSAPTGAAPDSSVATSTPPTQEPGGEVAPSTSPTTSPRTSPPTTAPPVPRIVVVGDSTALALGLGLQEWGNETGRLEASFIGRLGCATHFGSKNRVRNGFEFEPEGCETLFDDAIAEAERTSADAIVVFIGSLQLADWYIDDGWHALGEGAFDAAYRRALERAVGRLEQSGIPILWADVPAPAWDLDTFEQLYGVPVPGSGPTLVNDVERFNRLNDIDAAVLGNRSATLRWSYAAQLAGPDGTVDEKVRPDGLHLDEEAVGQLADDWMEATLIDAYRRVMASGASTLRTARPTTWQSP